jgi:hypothetical protein
VPTQPAASGPVQSPVSESSLTPTPFTSAQTQRPAQPRPQRHVTFDVGRGATCHPLGQQSLSRDQDDPFISSNISSATPGILAQAQQSPETFDLRVSLALSDSGSEGPETSEPLHPQARRPQNAPVDPYPPTPSRSRRQQRADRQRHAEQSEQSELTESGPAGNKKGRHVAKDVYTFFEEQNEKRVCKFCM